MRWDVHSLPFGPTVLSGLTFWSAAENLFSRPPIRHPGTRLNLPLQSEMQASFRYLPLQSDMQGSSPGIQQKDRLRVFPTSEPRTDILRHRPTHNNEGASQASRIWPVHTHSPRHRRHHIAKTFPLNPLSGHCLPAIRFQLARLSPQYSQKANYVRNSVIRRIRDPFLAAAVLRTTGAEQPRRRTNSCSAFFFPFPPDGWAQGYWQHRRPLWQCVF